MEINKESESMKDIGPSSESKSGMTNEGTYLC